jgi:ankyrin repeat protein
MWAVYHSNVESVKFLLENGADVNTRDEIGCNALMLSCQLNPPLQSHAEKSENALNIVCQLLNHYTETSICDKNGINALHYAAFAESADIVKCLLDSGINIDSVNAMKKTPILVAASTYNWNVIKLLIERNADTRVTDEYGNTVLHYLAGAGNIDLINILLNRNTESDENNEEQGRKILIVDAHNIDQKSLLHFAAEMGELCAVELLREKNADITACDVYGNNILHHAASSGNAELVKYLLDCGLQIDSCDKNGNTPLHFASSKGHHEVVMLLKDREANMTASNENCTSVLHTATWSGMLNL